MTDHPDPDDTLDALRDRADRGTPRGPEAVLAAARSEGLADPDLEAVPVGGAGGRRWVLTAAAAVLVVAGIGIALAVRHDAEAPAASGGAFCTALAASAVPPYDIDSDVVVYVEPGADEAVVAGLRGDIDADADVARARYIDRDATYQRFRALIRGEAVMLENVRPTDLPTSFELTLRSDADPRTVATEWRRHAGVWEVRDRATNALRVLDVLAWPGQDLHMVASDFISSGDPSVTAGWNERVEAVRAAASPEVAAAVDELAATLRDRRQPVEATDPAGARVLAATATLTDAAMNGCGLHPRPSPIGTHATADATTSSPPVPTTSIGTTTRPTDGPSTTSTMITDPLATTTRPESTTSVPEATTTAPQTTPTVVG